MILPGSAKWSLKRTAGFVRLLAEQLLQGLLALDQRLAAQILAVEPHQVEDVVDEAVGAPRRQIRCSSAKDETPLSASTTISPSMMASLHFSPASSADDLAAEFLRPVEAGAGQQPHVGAGDLRLHAIAVELHLVQPVLAGGRIPFQRRQLRLDEVEPLAGLRPWPWPAAGLLECQTFGFLPLARLAFADLLDRQAGLHRLRRFLQNILAGPRGGIVRLDQQPVVALLARARLQPHQMPVAHAACGR